VGARCAQTGNSLARPGRVHGTITELYDLGASRHMSPFGECFITYQAIEPRRHGVPLWQRTKACSTLLGPEIFGFKLRSPMASLSKMGVEDLPSRTSIRRALVLNSIKHASIRCRNGMGLDGLVAY